MNQMLFPGQLGPAQTMGQTGDSEQIDRGENGEYALFGLMVGLMQQPQLAEEWRQELAALGNGLPPDQAQALNRWAQKMASGQPGALDIDTLPEGVSRLLQDRLPAITAQLGQRLESSFGQAMATSASEAGLPTAAVPAVDGAQIKAPAPDAAKLWMLNPLTRTIKGENALEALETEPGVADDVDLPDGARALRAFGQALNEVRGGDPLVRTVTTPIHESSWGRNLAEQVMWVQQAGASRARLILDPPNLGPVDVELKMQGEQTSIVFHSPHQAVRDSIENSLPRLRELMAEQGINQLNVNISGGQSQEQRSSARDEFFAGGQGAGGDRNGVSGEDSASARVEAMTIGLGLVDYYA